MDSIGPGRQPQKNAGRIWVLFYIVFVFMGGFFTMNLFSAVIVDSYHQMNLKLDDLTSISKEQAEWVKIHQSIIRLTPGTRVSI